jgi:hypothetical protein
MKHALILLLFATTTHAAPLEGPAFEAETTGKTIQFKMQGQPYGAEQYLPGRRVIWAFEGGQCREGTWFEPIPGSICFVYDHDPVPQCWAFFKDGDRLRARFEGSGPESDLIETGRSPAPLACPGPWVGT